MFFSKITSGPTRSLPNPLGVVTCVEQKSMTILPTVAAGYRMALGRCSAMHLEISKCDRPHLQEFPRTAAPNTFRTWHSLAFLSFEHSSLLPSHLCENRQQARLDLESPGLRRSAASNQSTCAMTLDSLCSLKAS